MADHEPRFLGDVPEHVHTFGAFEFSRFSGTPVRRCQVPFCKEISLDGDDEE